MALGESFGQKDDRIDAGHLEVDGNARVFGGALKVKACIATAGKADGADARIADEFQAGFIADVVDHLNRGGGKVGCFDGFECLFGEQACRVGVKWMCFRNDRVAGGDGGGEVASADAVEGEGKVIRAEDDHGSNGSKAGADIFFEVERGVAPGLFRGLRLRLGEADL